MMYPRVLELAADCPTATSMAMSASRPAAESGLHATECQKQPSTNTAIRARGKTMSGRTRDCRLT